MADIEYDEKANATVKFIKEVLFKQAKAWKFNYSGDNHEKWLKAIRWYKGHQWPENHPQGKADIVNNMIFASIQRELPFMTDHMPKIWVKPDEPSDTEWAEFLEKTIAKGWVDRNMEYKLPETVMHAKQLGTAFIMPFWNEKLAGGLGDFDAMVIDPLEVFPFAYTKDMETTEGVIWARNVSLKYIKDNYKEGYRVKPDDNKSVPDRSTQTNSADGGYAQVTDTTGAETNYLPTGNDGTLKAEDLKRALLISVYMKDGATIKEGEDQDKNEPKRTTKTEEKITAKYPNGRVITIAGNILLEDKAFEWSFFPGFIDIKNYIEPSEFWGESDEVQIMRMQKNMNKLLSSLTDSVNRGVYTTKFIDSRSGIDVDTYLTTQDAVYETKVPNPVQEVNNQIVPAHVFNFLEIIKSMTEDISGVRDYNPPTSGNLPSGRSLQEMQEVTQVRLRQKIRNMEYGIRRLGKAWIEMILKNYTEARVMRMLNPNTRKDEYVYVFREEDQAVADAIREKISQETIPGTEQQDPQTGQMLPGQPKYTKILNIAEIQGDFDVDIATNSTVSTSQVAQFQQSFALFQAGVIDQQALLEAADYPNKDDILGRMAKAQQAAQEQQQQMMMLQIQMEQEKIKNDVSKNVLDNKTKLQTEVMKTDTAQLKQVNDILGGLDDSSDL